GPVDDEIVFECVGQVTNFAATPSAPLGTSKQYGYLTTVRGIDNVFSGSPHNETTAVLTFFNSFDMQATYAFTRRYSVSVTAPIVHGSVSSFRDHENDGIHRHTMTAAGVGDLRVVGNVWLFDPKQHHEGNISLSLGIKTPSGNSDARDTAYRPTGPAVIPVDIAIQPGDSGWGTVLEGVAFRKVSSRMYGYAAGFYLFNPREKNTRAVTTVPVYGQYRPLSVPDQYLRRVGLNYAVAPRKGLSVSLGGRVDGIPVRDVFGGSDGFRRPGMAVYLEPGVTLLHKANTFSVFVPVATYRNRERNTYDYEFGGHGPGAFANFVVIASVTRRF